MRLLGRAFLTVSLAGILATPMVGADILVDQTGSTNPSTNGFIGGYGSAVSGAWNIAGSWCCTFDYWTPTALQLSDIASAANWELTTTYSNLSTDTGGGACCGPDTFGSNVSVSLNGIRFDLDLHSDGLGNQILSVNPFAGTPDYTIAGLGTNYVTLEVLYNNATQTGDIFVNGTQVISDYVGHTNYLDPVGVRFGGEDGDFSQIELADNVSTPEPNQFPVLLGVMGFGLFRLKGRLRYSSRV